MEKYLKKSDESKALFRLIFDSFKRYQVDPTPLNFLVWYEYHLSENKALVKTMNEALASNAVYNDLLGFRVYQSFLRPAAENIHLVNDDMITHIRDISSGVQDFNEHIETHLSLLNCVEQNEEVTCQLTDLTTRLKDTQKRFVETAKTSIRLNQHLKSLGDFVLRDPITQVYSQEKLEKDFKNWVNRTEQIPGLVMIDVDNFRQLNKLLDITSSEKILRIIGCVLKREIGEHACYRIKGEDEFCLMTGEHEETPLNALLEKAEAAIANIRLKSKADDETLDISLEVSGVVVWPLNGDLQQGFAEAHRRMKYLKRNKRNQKVS